MKYLLNINDRAFCGIKNKTKRIEIRVTTDEKRINYSLIKPNDTLEFINSKKEKINCMVLENNWYANEKELLYI